MQKHFLSASCNSFGGRHALRVPPCAWGFKKGCSGKLVVLLGVVVDRSEERIVLEPWLRFSRMSSISVVYLPILM